jgi:glycosyltransferase involved in cell wall biosynthesis
MMGQSDKPSAPTIGVVVRTLNERELIGRCLEVLRRQAGGFALDVVVVDSGSTDGTIAIAAGHGARIVHLPPGEFDYSRSLNVGIDAARGDIIVSLSAHAIPTDDSWLERMVAPFAEAKVAGVSCRQVPWPDAPWQEVHRLAHQFDQRPRVYARNGIEELVFSNAASALRRAVWADHPFTLPAAEDLDWARRVISAGWLTVYEPDAVVFHSHYESPREQALRMIDINRVQDSRVGDRTRRRALREAAGMLVRDGRKIMGLDEPLRRKTAYLADLALMVGYYVVDFSRAGTTAERRREDARSAQTS